MILTCPQCSTRLQLETSKLPTRSFTVKCPKCQNLISVAPPEVASGEPAPTTAPRTAPCAQPPEEDKATLSGSKLPKMPSEMTTPADVMEQEALKNLAAMLAATFAQSGKPLSVEPTRHRRMVVCLSDEEEVKKVQSLLQGYDFDLTFIESSEQAIELLQLSNQVDMILLDPHLEDDQGGTAILRFINSLNPGRRRRLYVTLMSPSYKTVDTQAAFAAGVNLFINSSEIAMLPLALNKGIREFNLLYRSYNEASGLSPV
jgi:predicted Zn finger-like uncharacterized protein